MPVWPDESGHPSSGLAEIFAETELPFLSRQGCTHKNRIFGSSTETYLIVVMSFPGVVL